MRLLLILAALAAGALLAWLNVRDLIGLLRRGPSAADPTRCSTPEQPDPMDAVQSDPWPYATGGVVGPIAPFIVGESGPERVLASDLWDESAARYLASDDLAPAYTPDMPYLEAVPLAHMRRAFSTQSGPLGPTA